MAESLYKALPWLLLFSWMGLIFALSHQPSNALPHFGAMDLSIKKGAHFLGYFVLAIFARGAMGHSGWAMIWTAVYAISDEIHQTFIPGRQASILDVLIDCAGGLTGLLMYHFFLAGVHRREPTSNLQRGQRTPGAPTNERKMGHG